MRKLKVGDEVTIECFSNMGSGGGQNKVTKITKKYDENTGKSYKVIWCGKRGFSAKSGAAVTEPYMYYIL